MKTMFWFCKAGGRMGLVIFITPLFSDQGAATRLRKGFGGSIKKAAAFGLRPSI